MSKFYETMHNLGYEVESDRTRPGFESFKKSEERFDSIIFFFFKERKMKGYIIPKLLFTKMDEVTELRDKMNSINDTLMYLKILSNYDIINN